MEVGIGCGIERLLRRETLLPPSEGRKEGRKESVFDEGEIDLIIISIGSRREERPGERASGRSGT